MDAAFNCAAFPLQLKGTFMLLPTSVPPKKFSWLRFENTIFALYGEMAFCKSDASTPPGVIIPVFA